MLDFEDSCPAPPAAKHVLAIPDHDTLPILPRTCQLRRRHFWRYHQGECHGQRRSGQCGDDCHY